MARRNGGWLAAVLLVGAAGAGGWYYSKNKKGPEVRYETVKVDKGRIAAKVTASGVLSALVTVQVGSQVSGRVAEISADFNSNVKKGQLIAKIDPQLFEASLEQAKANDVAAAANLAKAKVQALDARRQSKRSEELAERKLIAQADLDTARTNAEAAEAAVQAAEGAVAQSKANLHSAQVNLAYTSIISPINGTVISRSVDVGQTVAASLQAPTLFTIAEDLKKMQVDTNIAEADVGKLEPSMTALFRVDAYPSERFKGTIRQIRNAPQTVQNVVTYDAVIDVDNAELKLRPGMTANVTVPYAEKQDVLRVPNAALRFRPPASFGKKDKEAGGSGLVASAGAEPRRGNREGHEGKEGREGGASDKPHSDGPTPDERTVYRLHDQIAEPVRIKIGVSDGSLTEVAGGELQDGDVLITEVIGGDAKGPGGNPNAFRRMF
jgi:HlyD family secretion protein